MSFGSSLLYAIVGGVVPALVWLWFWRREDRLHPEPRWLILICFLGGMLAVPLVIPLEHWVNIYFGSTGAAFVLWALIEEVFKYGAAFLTVLTRREVDEPIDDLIYLITAALGFAAMENIFFLIVPLMQGDLATSLITGNLRSIGATLLHVISSATVGIFIAFGYFHTRRQKRILTTIGLFLAVVLHTLFNLSIISDVTIIQSITFYSVWIAVVVLLLFFEKVKTITNPLETL